MTFHQSVHAQPAKLIIEPLHHLRSTGFDFKDSPFLSSSTAYMNIKVIRAREVTGGRTPSPAPYLNSHHQPSGDLPPIYIQFLPSSSSSHTARSLRRILRRRGYLLAPRRSVKLDANTLSPPTSHLPGIPLMSFVSSPRPIYLCIYDSQIYRRRHPGPTASPSSPRYDSQLAVFWPA